MSWLNGVFNGYTAPQEDHLVIDVTFPGQGRCAWGRGGCLSPRDSGMAALAVTTSYQLLTSNAPYLFSLPACALLTAVPLASDLLHHRSPSPAPQSSEAELFTCQINFCSASFQIVEISDSCNQSRHLRRQPAKSSFAAYVIRLDHIPLYVLGELRHFFVPDM